MYSKEHGWSRKPWPYLAYGAGFGSLSTLAHGDWLGGIAAVVLGAAAGGVCWLFKRNAPVRTHDEEVRRGYRWIYAIIAICVPYLVWALVLR